MKVTEGGAPGGAGSSVLVLILVAVRQAAAFIIVTDFLTLPYPQTFPWNCGGPSHLAFDLAV